MASKEGFQHKGPDRSPWDKAFHSNSDRDHQKRANEIEKLRQTAEMQLSEIDVCKIEGGSRRRTDERIEDMHIRWQEDSYFDHLPYE